MENEIAVNYACVMAVQITFVISAMFPGTSLSMYQRLVKKWALHKERMLLKRTRRTEEKMKNYWEIDMKNFR